MRTSRIILIILVLAVIGVGVYVLLTPEALDPFRPATTVTDSEQIDQMALAFVGTPYPDDYSLLRIPGWVDNQSKQKLRTVTLEIQLLDEKGAKKEKITYDVTDVEPNTRTTFDINAGTLPPSRTATVAITKIEAIDQ
jgi:hypothetical protein